MKNYLYLCVDVLGRLLNILSYIFTYLLLHLIDEGLYIRNIHIYEQYYDIMKNNPILFK